jgi:hypothetical protein
MPINSIEYNRMVEGALRRVVHDALKIVEQQGLPGHHHHYITFRTNRPGVEVSDALYARYPDEMTIVLQHEFWALEVDDEGFAVTLSFNNTPERVRVPFEAITVFADPGAEFGLQFQGDAAGEAAEGDGPVENASAPSPAPDEERPATVTALPKPGKNEAGGSEGAAEVVPLDQFRKR